MAGNLRQPTTWLLIGATAAVIAAASVTSADPDLWGHLRFGLDLLHTRHLTSVDPYSFTQDQPWINHEWLSELQMGIAWALAGTPGLVLLKALLVSATLGLVWSAFAHTNFVARVAVMAVVVLGAGRASKTLRPQLWSLLCFVALCRVLAEHQPRAARWLPVLFVFWANVHGGWLVGLGVLGVWAVADVFAHPSQWRSWAVLVPLCALATLATPYGWTLWAFMASTVRLGRDVTEWQPLWTVPVTAWMPWAAAVIASIWALVWTARAPHSNRLAEAGVLAMLAVASLRVERLTPFFVIAAAVLLAPRVRARWPAAGGLTRTAHDIALAATLAAIAITASAFFVVSSSRCVTVSGPWVPDDEAARFLDDARPGRLVTFFDWGQYALWHWGPALQVSMDGRRETIYSEMRLNQHDSVVRGTSVGVATLTEWQAEYVWLPAGSTATRQWLETHGYRIEVDTPQSFVATRSDLPALTRRRGGVTMPRCFPR